MADIRLRTKESVPGYINTTSALQHNTKYYALFIALEVVPLFLLYRSCTHSTVWPCIKHIIIIFVL